MDNMVGVLAIFTMGAVFVIGAFLFLNHNRDPKNLDATKRVVKDDSSATTGVRGGRQPNDFKS